MDIWTVTGANPELFGWVLGGLFGFGFGYNWLVAWLESRGYHDGYVAVLVVFGTGVTLVGAGMLLGWGDVLVLFMLFGASGFWMVAGSMWRHARAREDSRLNYLAGLERIENIIEERFDD